MVIRDEAPGDAAAVRRVVSAAFGRTEEADLVEALRETGAAALALVAEEAGAIVGHVLFSRLRAPAGCLALAPVAVAPGRQGRGIGAALIRDGLARAGRAGWRAVFVVGAPAYYARFGFRADPAAPFETPYPKAYVLALELAPGALSGRGGPLLYAPPFQGLE